MVERCSAARSGVHSNGYRILELGPDELVGKGRVEMAEMECRVRRARGAK